ncbi:MAG TPA: hypothetical protein VJ810_24425 [Blastocatellia bacterium]|nr:hypothetical protein [Blastocatellia bacterium]
MNEFNVGIAGYGHLALFGVLIPLLAVKSSRKLLALDLHIVSQGGLSPQLIPCQSMRNAQCAMDNTFPRGLTSAATALSH